MAIELGFDGELAKSATEAMMPWLDVHVLDLCKFVAAPGDYSGGDSAWCDPITNVTVSDTIMGESSDFPKGVDDSAYGASTIFLILEPLPSDDLPCTTWVVWPIV